MEVASWVRSERERVRSIRWRDLCEGLFIINDETAILKEGTEQKKTEKTCESNGSVCHASATRDPRPNLVVA